MWLCSRPIAWEDTDEWVVKRLFAHDCTHSHTPQLICIFVYRTSVYLATASTNLFFFNNALPSSLSVAALFESDIACDRNGSSYKGIKYPRGVPGIAPIKTQKKNVKSCLDKSRFKNCKHDLTSVFALIPRELVYLEIESEHFLNNDLKIYT